MWITKQMNYGIHAHMSSAQLTPICSSGQEVSSSNKKIHKSKYQNNEMRTIKRICKLQKLLYKLIQSLKLYKLYWII